MAHFIDTAKHKLDVQHPKFVDAVILDRLLEAADRGARAFFVAGNTASVTGMFSTRFPRCECSSASSQVHNKESPASRQLLLVDEVHALVGSMNIDRSAFDPPSRVGHDDQGRSRGQTAYGRL
jgi:phosphatidylserine/phosphatidylglycerophosphate/cardiolipin synthase-like enzyme